MERTKQQILSLMFDDWIRHGSKKKKKYCWQYIFSCLNSVGTEMRLLLVVSVGHKFSSACRIHPSLPNMFDWSSTWGWKQLVSFILFHLKNTSPLFVSRQAFMEDVKSRGPFIYSVLESAQAFLAQHPFQEPEETLTDGKGLLPAYPVPACQPLHQPKHHTHNLPGFV